MHYKPGLRCWLPGECIEDQVCDVGCLQSALQTRSAMLAACRVHYKPGLRCWLHAKCITDQVCDVGCLQSTLLTRSEMVAACRVLYWPGLRCWLPAECITDQVCDVGDLQSIVHGPQAVVLPQLHLSVHRLIKSNSKSNIFINSITHYKEHRYIPTAIHDQHWSIYLPSGSRKGRVILLNPIIIRNYTFIWKSLYNTELVHIYLWQGYARYTINAKRTDKGYSNIEYAFSVNLKFGQLVKIIITTHFVRLILTVNWSALWDLSWQLTELLCEAYLDT